VNPRRGWTLNIKNASWWLEHFVLIESGDDEVGKGDVLLLNVLLVSFVMIFFRESIYQTPGGV